MARTRPHRPECFDRAGRLIEDSIAFIATPPAGRPHLTINGAEVPAGARIDKRSVDPRRLRQMYEARLIAVVPESMPAPKRRGGRGGALAAPKKAAPASKARRALARAAV